jgi:hypothetical protein
MNLYRAYFYYGRDRDDWTSHDFASPDLTSALDRATHLVPYGYNLWKVELIDNQRDNTNPFNRYLNEQKD